MWLSQKIASNTRSFKISPISFTSSNQMVLNHIVNNQIKKAKDSRIGNGNSTQFASCKQN